MSNCVTGVCSLTFYTHFGYNCWSAIFWKIVSAIMHNTGIIIGGIRKRQLRVGVLSKLDFFAYFNIFPMDINEFIPIVDLVHVIKTKSFGNTIKKCYKELNDFTFPCKIYCFTMIEFMHYWCLNKASIPDFTFLQVQHLFSMLKSNFWVATAIFGLQKSNSFYCIEQTDEEQSISLQ